MSHNNHQRHQQQENTIPLEDLRRFAAFVEECQTIKLMEGAAMVNAGIPDIRFKSPDLNKIVDECKKKVLARREEVMRTLKDHFINNKNTLIEFDDEDGDNIKITVNKGVEININGQVLVGKLIFTNGLDHHRFEYKWGSNVWRWEIDVKNRTCEGRSPRTFHTKSMSAIMKKYESK